MDGGRSWWKKTIGVLVPPFRIISIILLSLLLPLSFLFLSRLAAAGAGEYSGELPRFNPTLLYTIVSSVCIASLLHILSGKITSSIFHRRIYIPWIVLFLLQASVGVGVITGSEITDMPLFSFRRPRTVNLLIRVLLFFLGLHETMLFWFRVVVKPVVDDTIFGVYEEEKLSERAAVAVSFGTIWVWKLREETEALVAVAEAKMDLLAELEVVDFVNWWLYYVCVGIGMVRVLKGLFWVWDEMVSRFRSVKKQGFARCGSCEFIDEKV